MRLDDGEEDVETVFESSGLWLIGGSPHSGARLWLWRELAGQHMHLGDGEAGAEAVLV